MIDNTTASGAFSHLAEMMTSGRSDYVEKMEADGQRQLVESDLMPADGPWSELAELGFSQGALGVLGIVYSAGEYGLEVIVVIRGGGDQ